MSGLLDILLVFITLVAVFEGFQRGMLRMALRFVATIFGLAFAALVVRITLVAGFIEVEGWGFFLTYMSAFAVGSGVGDGIAGLIYRQLRPAEPAEPASEDEIAFGGVKAKRMTGNVYVVTTTPERIVGAVIGGVNTAISNGVFVLVLTLLPVDWITQAISGSNLADSFMNLARSVSFLLPPELRLW